MNIDLENSEWKKIGLILLGVLSIIPLHIASFTYGLPNPFRQFLDAEIKNTIAFDVGTKAILFSFLARYIPQFSYGIISWIHGMTIEFKYFRRGYRRVYVSFTGFGKKARRIKTRADLSAHFRRCGEFSRANARFTNLRRSSLQRTFKIEHYEQHRNSITAVLGVALFVFSYVGFLRGLLVLLVVAVFAASAIFYSSSNSAFRFNLTMDYWNEQEGKDSFAIDIDDIGMIVASVACAAALSGYLRVGYLASHFDAFLNDENAPVSIIASNSDGLLVFQPNRSFEFVSWPKSIRED